MHRRTVIASAASALAAGLAGCSGDGDGGGGGYGGGAGDDTDTPAPTPDPDADWTDGDGLAVDALADAHVGVLTDAGSFTVRSIADTSHAGAERPDEWLFSQTLETRFDAETERQSIRHELTEVDETSEAYVTTDRAYVRQEVDGEVQYDTQDLDRSSEEFRAAMAEEARTGTGGLADWNLTYAATTTVDGWPAFRYEADAYDGDRGVPAEIETAAAAAVIDERGLIRRIEQSFAGRHEDQDVEVDVTIEYVDIGATTVPEPDWLDEAAAATNESGRPLSDLKRRDLRPAYRFNAPQRP